MTSFQNLILFSPLISEKHAGATMSLKFEPGKCVESQFAQQPCTDSNRMGPI